MPVQFFEEFVRCYEKHIADYKRTERGDGGVLKTTVMMDSNKAPAESTDPEDIVDQVDHGSDW